MNEEQQKMLERIYNEIVGDPFTDGIIPRMNKLTKKVDNHEMYFRIIWGFGAILAFIVAIYEGFKKIIE